MEHQGENSGAPNWWYRPEGRRQRLGSREDLNQRFDAMDDRQETGSSETAGRNRYPRLNVSQGEYSPMLKPLTLSLSLAVALGFCSVSMAGVGDGCTTCGLASPRVARSPALRDRSHLRHAAAPQEVQLVQRTWRPFQWPPLQAEVALHPPVTYEWVLKKKRLWGHHGWAAGCGSRAAAPAVVLLRFMQPARLLPRARVAMPLRQARVATLLPRGRVAMPLLRPHQFTVLASIPTCLASLPRRSPRFLPR